MPASGAMTADEGGAVTPEPWGRNHEVAVLAMLEVLPGVGGALATVVGEVFDRRRARVREFATQVLDQAPPAELIERLRRDPRFGDLFVLAVERVARADWEPKRVAMGRVVVRALTEPAVIDESERLLDALHDLGALDFAVLAQLHAQTRHRPEGEGVGLTAIPGLAGAIGPLYRHGVLIQVSDYSLFYRSTPAADLLLGLVSMPADARSEGP